MYLLMLREGGQRDQAPPFLCYVINAAWASLAGACCVCFVGNRCGLRVLHLIVLAAAVVWCADWDLSGDVLAAPEPALCGWIGVTPLCSLSPLADPKR